MFDEIISKYKALFTSLKKIGCIDLELNLLFPNMEFKVKKMEKEIVVVTCKSAATVFNNIQKFGIYTVQINKNDISLAYKSNNLDTLNTRVKVLSSSLKENFNSDMRKIQSDFTLNKKKKDKLSDEERHEINEFQKKLTKTNEEFSKQLKIFEKLVK